MSFEVVVVSQLKSRSIGDDYGNLCRFCLMNTSMKINIFGEESIRREIPTALLKCLSLTVSIDNCLV